ncbi:MAG: hypothetical protein CMJ18_15685 [Phycisphaeraceae bacterium]|nr:hypothetical protein [Phycisphaeraceae bacterium]
MRSWPETLRRRGAERHSNPDCASRRPVASSIERLELRLLMSALPFIDPTHSAGHACGGACPICATSADSAPQWEVAVLDDHEHPDGDVVWSGGGEYEEIDASGGVLSVLPTVSPVAAPPVGPQIGSTVTPAIGAPWPAATDGSAPAGAPSASAGAVPQYQSLPGAAATLYLDFDGHFEAQWGAYDNVTTPSFSLDGDTGSFSSAELTRIEEIWARIAEDFAPFDINVTTVEPPSFANGDGLRVAIGGTSYDWLGVPAGGVGYVGSFTNFLANTVYVFPAQLGGGNARNISEAASHEAGHGFGLDHQSLWSGGALVEQYHPGGSGWAPIMGVSYYQNLTTWNDGTNQFGEGQDDLSVLSGPINGFGYRTDDHGDVFGASSMLSVAGTSIFGGGVIQQTGDADVFRFDAGAGPLTVAIDVARHGANLDVATGLYDAGGQLVQNSAPGGTLDALISTTVSEGTYYLVVQAESDYGRLGQYEIAGTISPLAPDDGGGDTGDGDPGGGGDSGDGGDPGDGGGESGGDGGGDPGGDGGDPGGGDDPGGDGSGDGGGGDPGGDGGGDPAAPEISVWWGDDPIFDGEPDAIDFGTIEVGDESPTVTFTVINDGDATLTLGAPLLTEGFTLVEGLSTSLAPGASDTFTVALDSSVVGEWLGQLGIVSNDPDEALFNFAIAGSVTEDLPRTFWMTHGVNVSFVDADGDIVTARMRGPGSGTLTLTGSDTGDVASIDLSGTTIKSSLLISTRGATTVGDVTVDGSLGRLYGRGASLVGDVVVSGLLKAVRMDHASATHQQTISVGGAGAGRLKLSFTFDTVADLDIESGMAIKRVRVDQWADAAGASDRIVAPSVDQLSAKHDFGADVEVTDVATKRALGRMKVGGWLDGAQVRSAGRIGSVTVGGMRHSSIMAGVDTDGLPDGASDFQAQTTIDRLTVKGFRKTGGAAFIDSDVAAWSIRSARIKDISGNNGGNPFGLALNNYKRMKVDFHEAGASTSEAGTQFVETSGDFEVRLV